jgi:Na+-translocating ferredoxin:NAD+ oxidoreductase RNF subunit RnfB
MICDFCVQQAVLVNTYYPAGTLIAHYSCGASFVDGGGWGACAECHRLIAARLYADLIDRCVPGVQRVAEQVGTALDVNKAREQMRFALTHVLGEKI